MSDKTVVLFRIVDEQVVALFPEIPTDAYSIYCSCYSHIGQHGAADSHLVIGAGTPASIEEYAELGTELQRMGYNLLIRKRYTKKMQENREAIQKAWRDSPTGQMWQNVHNQEDV